MATVSTIFVGTPEDVAAARHWIRDISRWLGVATLVEPMELVVSELTTNAVLHGRPPFQLSLTERQKGIRIAVRDQASEPAVRRPVDLDDLSGRGMRVVETVSVEWGVVFHPYGGKTVWADLPTLEPPSSSAPVGLTLIPRRRPWPRRNGIDV